MHLWGGAGGEGGGMLSAALEETLEHPRRWQDALWSGLFLGLCAAQRRQARPEEVTEPSSGTANGAV